MLAFDVYGGARDAPLPAAPPRCLERPPTRLAVVARSLPQLHHMVMLCNANDANMLNKISIVIEKVRSQFQMIGIGHE